MSKIKVNRLENTSTANGGIDIDTSGHVQVDGLQMPTAGALSNRNLIINGAMQVAQRGTSQTGAGYGSIDRFSLSLSGATATMSQESFTLGQTDVPGADKYLKLDVSTGNNNSGIFYKIEAQNVYHVINNTVTLSYYAKGTSPTNGLKVGIMWYDGSNPSTRVTESVTLTNSWVKYTHTFTVPSISGITLTNSAAFLEVSMTQDNGDTGTAAYEVNLAQVQLEVGSKATPFEHESYGQTLAKCQKYFYRKLAFNAQPVWLYSDTAGSTQIHFPTEMRANPTFSYSGTLATDINIYYGPSVAYRSFSGLGGSAASRQSARIDVTGISPAVTAGYSLGLYVFNNAYLDFDAEL